MQIIIISAMAKNRTIGKDGKIPWYLKEDFAYFKQQTTGFPVIMGKNTFNSLPFSLPDRENIIITRYPIEGFPCFSSIKDALDYCIIKNYKKTFLIGGESIYKEGLDYADTILLTEIDKEFNGDTFFPEFSNTDFKLIEAQNSYSEENDFNYSFKVYQKT